MRITQLLHICFALASIAGLSERISHLADTASNAMHIHLKSFDQTYKQMKNAALEKLNVTFGKTKEIVARNEIFKPRSLKEFKDLFNNLVNKARENTRKEKVIETAKEEEEEKKKQKEEKKEEEKQEEKRQEL